MRRIILSCVLLFASSLNVTNAQLAENFNDGDFTNNPTWTGSTGDWTVNPSFQLQSNNTIANSTFYLSTANTLATGVQWNMFIKLAFNTSRDNYVDIYLIASDSALNKTSTSGYFVRLGGTADEISLFKKDINGDTVRLIDGVNGILDKSSSTLNLRVTRTAASQWSLFRDIGGTGSNFVLEGTATDNTYITTSYFGVFVKQSSSGFFGKHFFDDIVIDTLVPDVTPPVVQSATLLSGTTVDVLFDEAVDAVTAQNVGNYIVDNSIGSPVSAVLDAVNPALVHLTFWATFPIGTLNTLTVSNVIDLVGNAIVSSTGTFSYTPDLTPPALVSSIATSQTTVDVLFSEAVDITSAQQVVNYSADNGLGNPVSAVTDVSNPSFVHLVFGSDFPTGTLVTLTVTNINDLSGNGMAIGTATFIYTPPYTAQAYDVVIDEIMADPNPVQALRDEEFIEIKNRTSNNINLQGWTLSSLSTTSGGFPAYTLPPGGYLILTGTSNIGVLAPFGPVLGITSFPALLNDGTTLSLKSKEGVTIHAISYNTSWYKNSVKSNGGWSLEMADTQSPCTGADNWKASEDSKGGTPGAVNSVNGSNPDQMAPALLRAAAIDSVTLELTFSEAIDSARGATRGNYVLSNALNAVAASTAGPAFNKVYITLSAPLQPLTVYTVTVHDVTDCSGNTIQAVNSTRFGLPGVIDNFDIVVNEVLFNPKAPNTSDYVEIYNRSNKIFDLKDVYIANRDLLTSNLRTVSQVSTESILLFPGEYYVLSENDALVKQNYFAKNPDNFINVSMPSYNDDEGIVVLLNAVGNVVDELHYSDKWHFALIDNDEGISLERIDFNKPTQDKSNWFSAASTAGYGTPSYQNSQFRMDLMVQGEVTITPKIFSPDGDGFDDFATINYQMADAGYVANITIFDASGRAVKALAQNATLSQSGSFRWDGLDDKLNRVQVGTYIIYTQLFDLDGKRKNFKNTVTVGRRF